MSTAVYSQNGYRANVVSLTRVYTVPKSKVRLRLREGDVAALLLYVAAWVDQNVEDIDTRHGVKSYNVPDDWSFAVRPIRGQTRTLSNHASGTAIDINAVAHQRGVHHTWSDSEKAKINAFLRTLGGTVRWGEMYSSASTIDGMHFEIVGSPAQVRAVVRRLGLKTGTSSRTKSAAVLAVLALAAAGFGVGTSANPGPAKPTPKPKPTATSTATHTSTKTPTKVTTPTKKPTKPVVKKTVKPKLKRVLAVGVRKGNDVKYLQKALRLMADGHYGKRTKAAVVKFQKSKHLSHDGRVGQRTWSKLPTKI